MLFVSTLLCTRLQMCCCDLSIPWRKAISVLPKQMKGGRLQPSQKPWVLPERARHFEESAFSLFFFFFTPHSVLKTQHYHCVIFLSPCVKSCHVFRIWLRGHKGHHCGIVKLSAVVTASHTLSLKENFTAEKLWIYWFAIRTLNSVMEAEFQFMNVCQCFNF